MTEVKTQLDAETGEERRWEEERVEVVIDLTGEHEDEEVAATQDAGSGQEVAINQVTDEDAKFWVVPDTKENQQEEAGEMREGDGANNSFSSKDSTIYPTSHPRQLTDENDGSIRNMSGGSNACGGEYDEKMVGEDLVELNEVAEGENVVVDHQYCAPSAYPAPCASPASSNATTEPLEEDDERDTTVSTGSAKVDGIQEVQTGSSSFSPIKPVPLHSINGTSHDLMMIKSPVKEHDKAIGDGIEGHNIGDEDNSSIADLASAAVFPPTPFLVQLGEKPVATCKTMFSNMPLRLKDQTTLKIATGPPTYAIPQKTRAEEASPANKVLAESLKRSSDAPDLVKTVHEVILRKCRVNLPRMAYPQEGMCRDPGHQVHRKGLKCERQNTEKEQKSKIFKKENPRKDIKPGELPKGEECLGCGEIFSNLRRHQKLPHDVSCPNDYCERSFTSEEQLRKHMAEEHLVFARGGACDACGEQFPDDLQLAIHISQCAEIIELEED